MTFQVNGTTRINDSRQLVNITNGEAFTASAVGGAASEAIGTYAFLGKDTGPWAAVSGTSNIPGEAFGGNVAGSILYPFGLDADGVVISNYNFANFTPTGRSGTWKCMGFTNNTQLHPFSTDHFYMSLYLRVA